MNKVLWIVVWVVLGLALVGSSTYLIVGLIKLNEFEKEKRLIDASIEVVDVVAKVYSGELGVGRLKSGEYADVIDEGVYEKITKLDNDLKNMRETRFNVTEFYNKNFLMLEEEFDQPFGDGKSVDDDLPVKPKKNDGGNFDRESKDKRIYTENGVDYIDLKDLDMDNGFDLVEYKGILMRVPEEDLPITYEDIITDPKNKFEYASYKEIRENKKIKEIDVVFDSVANGDPLIVRTKIKDGRINDFEVRYSPLSSIEK